ncbi:phospholipid scramblase 2-like [Mya arenaria]|uniref:phospholipid scramblase 2-like n=1 Tax=Mya arenaria TaxID=6604 RepID=UPI0022E28239|nr:phospholipid scramblase 2-like [Mya arenaria]
MSVEKQPMGMELQPTGLPASLTYLQDLDQITIKQKIEMLEVLTGFETRNRYAVLNKEGQQIFFVQEESSLCERCFCAPNRGFQLHMTDNNSQEVVRMSREFKFCMGCCWCGGGCCQMEIVVESPVGRVLGKIRTGTSKWKAHVQVYDATDKHVFTIWGMCCPCQTPCCKEDLNFPITTPDLSQRVGNIAREWRGCFVDCCTDADTLRLEFPVDMTLDCKMLLTGAAFMIEYYIFEMEKNGNGQ